MEIQERLPDFVLADLFGKSLISLDEKPLQKKDEQPKTEKWFLGNYEKKIIVLVSNEKDVYLNEEDFSFLTTILNACKLNVAHIALINYYNNEVDFKKLKRELQPSYLLSFGIDALQIQLPFTMPHYQVQQYDKCYIVIAPSLKELNQQVQQSKTEKAKLWKSLQKMFGLEK